MKPLGTGVNLWPSTPATYPYTTTCTNLDALKTWFSTTSNRNSFAHLSHTFTHEDQNNATYFDVSREIVWNRRWLTQVGIAAASRFSPNGLVPPAITGLRNGDALRAWRDNGITNAVGDNTRPGLLNTVRYPRHFHDGLLLTLIIPAKRALASHHHCERQRLSWYPDHPSLGHQHLLQRKFTPCCERRLLRVLSLHSATFLNALY